ncbi:flavodoxin [Piscinibacter gummiphilus]|uniref:Flavodoxin n=1 Tax=Piscinibacter gummiphilus TaxID=946333 RepID=A0ABZ0CQY3_9BURK|nr:flavodoxin [Piscinibacter gummiphilus]WOB07398.1 flavodoxin [Piscinibacter gummiphilus]
MNKVLVVTYSNTGTSLRLARRLCALKGWPLGEVDDAAPRHGVAGAWRCVLDSLLRRTPGIDYAGALPSEFDTVVLVAPIWLYRLAGPMRSFVTRYRSELHDVAVISVTEQPGPHDAPDEITRITGRAPLLHTDFTGQDADDGRCGLRLLAFAHALVEAKDHVEPTRLVLAPTADQLIAGGLSRPQFPLLPDQDLRSWGSRKVPIG